MKLRKCSLLFAVVGALIFTAAFAPRANAVTMEPIVYFNFEDGTMTSVPAPGPGAAYPDLQTTTITSPPANDPFPGGQLVVTAGVGAPDGMDNQLAGDTNTTTSALDAMGNTSAMGSTAQYCFQFSLNTTGSLGVSLSYALQSLGNDGQFTTLTLGYATVANPALGDFTTFATHTDLQTHNTFFVYTDALPSGANNQADLSIQFCFSGSRNSAEGNHTYLDNIQVNTAIPEPATYIGSLFGIAGLCWCKRRSLASLLRLRHA